MPVAQKKEELAEVIKTSAPFDKTSFHFIVEPTDTVTVELEVYAKLVNGKRIPKILDRKRILSFKDTLIKSKLDVEKRIDNLKKINPNSVDIVGLEQEILDIDKTIKDIDDLLTTETTIITATFKTPDWALDAEIRRSSFVETVNGTRQWDDNTNRRARMTRLLVDWDLMQPDNAGRPVKVRKEQFEKVHSAIVDGFLQALDDKLSFDEADSKN